MKLREFTDEHVKILRDTGIEVVYLFGSQADETAGDMSDADFGVVLSDPSVLHGNLFRINGELYEVLRDILPEPYLERRKELSAHDFDIVFLQQASPRMRFKAAMTGTVLYRSSARAEADFRERSMIEYFDYRYFDEIANQSFLAVSQR
jgi:predicted nucleotidyltransferase